MALIFKQFQDFETLNEALCQQWREVIQHQAINANPSFAIAGGSTPAPVYQKLDILLQDLKLSAPVQLVATDERWVADQDSQSNEGLFKRCFKQSYSHAKVNFVSLKDNAVTPEVATSAIHERLEEHLPTPFNAVLLGMGSDGHIASLFPGAPTQHDQLNCIAAVHPTTHQSRISLSLPRLLETDKIWLVITGDDKRKVIEHAPESDLPISNLLRQAQCDIEVYWCP